MRYYYNSAGSAAKLLQTSARVVVMLEYKTLFFDDLSAARSFLVARGYY